MNARVDRVIRRAGALALAAVLPILIAPTARADTNIQISQDIETLCIGFGQTVYGLLIPDMGFTDNNYQRVYMLGAFFGVEVNR